MSETRETPDDETLRRLASGEAPLSDEAAHHAAWCAAEVLRLRAIIKGRTTPPTAAEIEAHHAAGGAWCVTDLGCGPKTKVVAFPIAARRAAFRCGCRWIALGRDGLPCAWPEVAR
jgi:hypothetical protein